MRPFDRVVLIFNHASTGDAWALAAELCAELQRRQPDLPVTLPPTKHAGHARDLARDAARTRRPLLVSVSSDGGYNEVVDGTMQAGNDAAVCAVLPARNANDHRRATREQPLADAIVTGSVTRIDLLRLTVGGSAYEDHQSGGQGQPLITSCRWLRETESRRCCVLPVLGHSQAIPPPSRSSLRE